jgi:hypothetical protein
MDQNARPGFYEGQYLGAEDLSAVVDYARIQQARHTLGAHTWGIAAGLEMRERPLASGEVEMSVLPGIAWDGYGRAVVVLAPARVGPEKFANFLGDTPAEGLLIKVWLRYHETTSRGPAPGFEVCRPDGQYARVVETFAIAVGELNEPEHGAVIVAGRSLDARKAKSAFIAGAPDLYDESVAYQEMPAGGTRPLWYIPIGYVRWLKTAGQPGKLIALSKTGVAGQPPDADLARAFRHYLGVVADTVNAADGIIRLRDRGRNPDPAISHVKLPTVTTNPAKPPENDLVWVEGALHVIGGDARVSGGKIELRDSSGSADNVPLALRRVEPNALGGKDLQIVLGATNPPTGANMLAVGNSKIDAATGQLKKDLTRHLVVRDDGRVGIGIDAPPELLTLGGEGNSRLEVARVSASLPWGTTLPTNPGGFVINQQSAGSANAGADFALMRDRKQRVVLGDIHTILSGQGGGDVVVFTNRNEPGEAEVLRATATGNVGINNASPVARLEVNGDVAIDSRASGAARILPAGGTLIWNDGTWLRLNQNLDFTKPIHGVHTPGLFAPKSLNVGGISGWADPGPDNAAIAGRLAIGALGGAETLHVEGAAHVTGTVDVGGNVNTGGNTNTAGNVNTNGNVNTGGNVNAAGNVNVGGDVNCTGTKNFRIAHPVDAADRDLVHAALEGPEAAVFYRGEAFLRDGMAEVVLPRYFEALTRDDARTITVTPLFRDDEPVSALAATVVRDGRFRVRAITAGNPAQPFHWEVKATRADVPRLAVEVERLTLTAKA